jgi:uncharacterized protein (DUF1684 family)
MARRFHEMSVWPVSIEFRIESSFRAERGWTVTLNPDGTTTARSPDGTKTLHSHSPPAARAG